MIRSDPIEFVDAELRAKLGKYAKAELAEAGEYFDQLVKLSETVHLVTHNESPIAVLGVVRKTLLGPVFFWFQLVDGINRGNLVALKRITPKLFQYYPRVETGVEVGWIEGERFAKFFGFRPFGEPYTVFGRTYQQYEARR